MSNDRKIDDGDKTRRNWNGYQYAKQMGHDEYCRKAKKCDNYFLGKQLSEEDRAFLIDSGRPPYEFNLIKPAINTAIAYQTNNRMEPILKPAGGRADSSLAELHTKVLKYVLNKNSYHNKETQIFADGVIMQRGYLEVTLDFSNNDYGDISIDVLDPLDVIPDPNAKSYNPKDWDEVTITRFYSLDDIEHYYGADKRKEVEEMEYTYGDYKFGSDVDEEERNSFATELRGSSKSSLDECYDDEVGIKRYRIIDKQRFVRKMTDCLIYPNGDIKTVEGISQEKLMELTSSGAMKTKRMMKRVEWTVTTKNVVLRDIISPFDTFTVIFYAPLFRRGITSGMVDDAIDAQDMFNKGISTQMHLANTNANAPWLIEDESLTNMSIDEFQQIGSKPGLVVSYKRGAEAPKRALPGQTNGDTMNLIELSRRAVYDSTIPESARGVQSNEISGVAIQAKQNAAQQQMVTALDLLAQTRSILVKKVLELVQKFYTNTRLIRITEIDPLNGKEIDSLVEVNQEMSDGTIINDLTVGEYDIIISETPLKSTFDETQFEQMMKMIQYNVEVPPEFVMLSSSLANKYDIADAMNKQKQNQQPDPLVMAKVKEIEMKLELMQTEKDHIRAQTTETNVKALYAGVQTAGTMLQNAMIADTAEEIAISSGFKDLNAAPIFKNPEGMGNAPIIQPQNGNTNPSLPMVPQSPVAGAMSGIENPN